MEASDQHHDTAIEATPLPDTTSPEAHPQPTPAPPPKRRSPIRQYWGWLVAAAVLAAAVAVGTVIAASRSDSTVEAVQVPGTTPTTVVPAGPATTIPSGANAVAASAESGGVSTVRLDASAVGEAVIPAVVTVQVRGATVNRSESLLGSGSGVVYDAAGHIITNNHVATAGSSYEIVLADGRVYPAELVGSDPFTDLAVLRISALGLTAIELGGTDEIAVGDPAVAVGSPLGLRGGPSLTVGVLSALGREVQTDSTTSLYGMLQTDAPITQGSSGGALVDAQGRLIGITTAVGVSSVGIEGIGFATPVEIVTRVADEIIADGSASRPYLGIQGGTAFADTSDGGSEPIGVEIAAVEPNTAAAAAGLTTDDVITAVDGRSIKTMEELVSLLRRYGAGSVVDVTLDSGVTVAATLGERPDDI